MVGAASENARAEPLELAAFAHSVRFAIEFPTAACGGEKSERLALAEILRAAFLGAAMVVVVGHFVLFEFGRDVEHRTGFEQCDSESFLSEDLDGGATARAGTDDNRVVDFLGILILRHGTILSQMRMMTESRHWTWGRIYPARGFSPVGPRIAMQSP